MAGSALNGIGRRYRRLGLLFGIPASLFWRLSVDTDFLLGFRCVYDKHGRKLPSPDARTNVADLSADACDENAGLHDCDAGLLRCST